MEGVCRGRRMVEGWLVAGERFDGEVSSHPPGAGLGLG